MNTRISAILAMSLLSLNAAAQQDTIFFRVSPETHSLQAEFDKALASASSPVVLELQEGTYPIVRPIVARRPAGAENPVIIRGKGKAVISGAMPLDKVTVAPDGLWHIDVSDILFVDNNIHQLYVGGRRAVKARTPNVGELFPTLGAEETRPDMELKAGPGGVSIERLFLNGEQMAAVPSTFTERDRLTIVGQHSWSVTKRKVDWFSPKDSSLYFTGDMQKPWARFEKHSHYYLEDDRSFLDAEGEWYFDRDALVILYKPRAGETPENAQVLLPVCDKLLSIKGIDASAPVRNVRLENLQFSYTRFTYPEVGLHPRQAEPKTVAAVELDFAEGVAFRNCEISSVAGNGIWFREACHGCSLRHSIVSEVGIGGVKIGLPAETPREAEEITRGTTVDNCIIQGGGREIATGCGVLVLRAAECHVTHNDIADFYYSGISVGWVWGYSYSPTIRNVISYNHVHHIGWAQLSDMGGIYHLCDGTGTLISRNVIHDIYAYSYGGWGLYTDEGSHDLQIADNLVYRCKSNGFHQHYGRENFIRNNIFVDNYRAQMAATRVEPHLSFYFTGNIVAYGCGMLFDPTRPDDNKHWAELNSVTDRNCYWHNGAEVLFDDKNIDEWRKATGRDANSIIADPKFRDPASDDYTPTSRAMMRKIGFRPFDISKAGVYGSAEWKSRAQLDPARIAEYNRLVAKRMAKESKQNIVSLHIN